MSFLKILSYFRFTFFLLSGALIALLFYGSIESYQGINSLVVNRTTQPWRFGFSSLVKGPEREVLFRGNAFPFPIKPGESFPLGRDKERDRIVGVYVESGKTKKDIPCPANFAFYRVEISATGIRCDGTDSRVSRWLANLPVTSVFLKSYARRFKELMAPEV